MSAHAVAVSSASGAVVVALPEEVCDCLAGGALSSSDSSSKAAADYKLTPDNFGARTYVTSLSRS